MAEIEILKQQYSNVLIDRANSLITLEEYERRCNILNLYCEGFISLHKLNESFER